MNPLKTLLRKNKYQTGGYNLVPGGTLEVAKYQQFLNSKGANLDIDGAWGPLTQKAYEQIILKSQPSAQIKTSLPKTSSGTWSWYQKLRDSEDTSKKVTPKPTGRFLTDNRETMVANMKRIHSLIPDSKNVSNPQPNPQLSLLETSSNQLAVPKLPSFNSRGQFTTEPEQTPINVMYNPLVDAVLQNKNVDDKVITTQDKRNLAGQFSEQDWSRKGVLNRSYDNRLYDTDKKLYELIQSGKINPKDFVYVDIGSGLGNESGQINKNPGATIKDLLSRKQLPTDFNIYATDLASEVKDFSENPNANKLWELGQNRLKVQPIDGFNPNFSFLKKENKNTVFLRAANSVDKLMKSVDAVTHFKKVASELYNKEVYYLYHNFLLYKPKKSGYFSIVDEINSAGFDNNRIYTPGRNDFSSNFQKKSSLKDLYNQKNNIS